jgi:ubiquinone/menaquinone biosynthesis C-methylase UbiE
MRLVEAEFKAMNTVSRRFLQRFYEYPRFKRMGIKYEKGHDMLEIGCGSGYGAKLLSELKPKSYVGIDVMPEQIELAKALAYKNRLVGYDFRLGDASDLSDIGSASIDTVVIFAVIHHIENWRNVIAECGRVLKKGGRMFIEEPDGRFLKKWDRVFKWNHPEEAVFSLEDVEKEMKTNGFRIQQKKNSFGFGAYAVVKESREGEKNICRQ